MADTEWYRRSTWTTADQAEFRERLNRSRGSSHKAQYLQIQAGYLQQQGGRSMQLAALELLDELIREHPERVQLAAAHQQRAECMSELGRLEESLIEYDAALAAERAYPSVRGTAYLGFAELVLTLGRSDRYAEVLETLDRYAGDELFPVLQYRSAAARAFIFEQQGRHDLAAQYAKKALEAARETESPFRYHRKLGLVDHPDRLVQARLRKLAALPVHPNQSVPGTLGR